MKFRFQLTKKKEMNLNAAKDFWQWFEENEKSIIKRYKTDGRRLVFEIDQKLQPIFPYYKGELEFQLGFNEGRGEFFFFHLKNKHLMRDGDTLGTLMPEAVKQRWRYILSE
ncbi:MAG: hypothetical protein IJW53_04705 [Clostridia bacterium]|nr:hypothetical protein [Clostridia bacterium]